MDLHVYNQTTAVLINAVLSGDTDTVRYLLECATNPDVPDKNGQKALHVAVASGKTEIIR